MSRRRSRVGLWRFLMGLWLWAGAPFAPLAAQDWHRSLDTLTIRSTPLVSVGLQQTRIDSLQLATVVSASMANVLSTSSTLFIKQYGRATLSTASFRGTAPSHTQVTWNGMSVNSPMLGMVDFSLIPSYFIDNATLYHGTASVNVTGGGLGGAVELKTQPVAHQGLELSYIQGIGSYASFDEFLKLRYGTSRWKGSTRVAYASSRNDYKYTNYRKLGYPVERNKNGQYNDFHILQEGYYTGEGGWKGSVALWYVDSKRGVPLLNVDYKETTQLNSVQDEHTLRAVATVSLDRGPWQAQAQGGYTYTDLRYVYGVRLVEDQAMTEMIHSQSYVNTAYGKVEASYTWNKKWMASANVSLHQHYVNSMDKAVLLSDGESAIVGYNKARAQWAGYAVVKYKPADYAGLSLSLREEVFGSDWAPLIPALAGHVRLSKKGNVTLKVAASRNYRHPTLNDLYFMPGGNPDLLPERGFSYDGGLSFQFSRKGFLLEGEVTGYDSYIDNWIVWLPTFKGFWSPINVKRVHSYGAEAKLKAAWEGPRWGRLDFNGNFAWTRSLNHGDPLSWADASIGKQLVYIPEFSGAFTARYTWRRWALAYQWTYYSERYTTSSSEYMWQLGVVPPYFMNDITLERRFVLKRLSIACKLQVNNLFNEEYETVLSRPMPRRNYHLFIELTL